MAHYDVQPDPGPSGTGRPNRRSLIGRKVGDFEIIREIGRGGMATVYEARQLSLGRTVALKVLSGTSSLTESGIIRFQREAQAAARLTHSHIVPIFAQGEDDGIYYYAMELINGPTVFQLIQQDRGETIADPDDETRAVHPEDETLILPSSPDLGEASTTASSTATRSKTTSTTAQIDHERCNQIAEHILHVADALAYASENRIIHRDIKPHNLMIGSDGRICVTDFGLARIMENPGVTVTGEFIGSPLYMSPEQISKGAGKVDHRTDVYSLGVTLYQWLTLEPPYPGDTREQVITRIITSEPPTPRFHSPNIPVDLETICMKAMEKDPNRRYATALDMRDDLKRYLDHKPIRARRANIFIRGARFLARHRTAVVVVLCAGVTLSILTAFWQRNQFAKQVEVQETTVKEQGAQLAEAKEAVDAAEIDKDALIEALARTITEKAWDTSKPLLSDNTKSTAERRALALHFARAMLATILTSTDVPAPPQGEDSILSQSADDLYTNALEAAGSNNFARSRTLLDAALLSEPDHFNSRLLRAIIACAMDELSITIDDSDYLLNQTGLSPVPLLLRGTGHVLLGNYAQGIDDLQKINDAEAIAAWVATMEGIAYFRENRFPEADLALGTAIRLSPRLVPARLYHARALYHLSKYNEAIQDASVVLEEDPNNTAAYIVRGECYDMLEEFTKSIEDYSRANSVEGGSSSILMKIALARLNQKRLEESRQGILPPSSETNTTGETTNGEADNKDPFEENPQWLDDLLRKHLPN